LKDDEEAMANYKEEQEKDDAPVDRLRLLNEQ